GEFRVEHVEAQLARLRLIALGRHEFEARIEIDEAPDQPAARHAVDVDPFAGDRGAPAQLLDRSRGWLPHRRLLLSAQPLLDAGNRVLGCLPSRRPEKINLLDLLEPTLQTRELALQVRALVVREPLALPELLYGRLGQGSDL